MTGVLSLARGANEPPDQLSACTAVEIARSSSTMYCWFPHFLVAVFLDSIRVCHFFCWVSANSSESLLHVSVVTLLMGDHGGSVLVDKT